MKQKTIAYLRVSTHEQDNDNQKLGLLEYCAARGLSAPEIVEDTASGTVHWTDRKIGALVKESPAGTTIVAAEISRLGRSTLQVLEILKEAAERKINVHITKNGLVMDGSMASKITATILALAAEIEREFISARTKESLRRRKELGQPLGRPKGQAKTLRLDAKEAEIRRFLQMGLSITATAKLVSTTRLTLARYVQRRGIKNAKQKELL